MNTAKPDIGCSLCNGLGGKGYHLDNNSRAKRTQKPLVVVCECVYPLCFCGAMLPTSTQQGPTYDELASRADEALSERDCPCHGVRRTVASINIALEEADIPDLYQGKQLEDYSIAFGDGRKIPGAERARSEAIEVMKLVVDGKEGGGLFLYGPPGDGKTLLASALLTTLILHTGRRGLFVKLTLGYFERLRKTFDDSEEETATQVINRLSRIRYLVLDDLGAERRSEWEVEWLYNLIDARYQNRRPIIVTSNNPLEDLQSASSKRIYSRLKHMCTVVKMPDQDLREHFAYVT